MYIFKVYMWNFDKPSMLWNDYHHQVNQHFHFIQLFLCVCVCVCVYAHACVYWEHLWFTILADSKHTLLFTIVTTVYIHNSHHTVKELIHLINESLYPWKHVTATVIIIIINLFINHLLYIKHSVKFLTCFI